MNSSLPTVTDGIIFCLSIVLKWRFMYPSWRCMSLKGLWQISFVFVSIPILNSSKFKKKDPSLLLERNHTWRGCGSGMVWKDVSDFRFSFPFATLLLLLVLELEESLIPPLLLLLFPSIFLGASGDWLDGGVLEAAADATGSQIWFLTNDQTGALESTTVSIDFLHKKEPL